MKYVTRGTIERKKKTLLLDYNLVLNIGAAIVFSYIVMLWCNRIGVANCTYAHTCVK